MKVLHAKTPLACLLLGAASLAHTSHIPDSTVVATVGRFSITARDFLDSYEFGPSFVKRTTHPVRSHLTYMIYERLLALEAERLHYDTTEFVHDRVTALEEDLTVDELYKNKIVSRVRVTENEIEAGAKKGRTNVRLHWIYATTPGEAQAISTQLKKGVPFDTLFAYQRNHEGVLADRSLETTVLKLETDNPDLAQGIAHLHANETSDPVKGPDGFYIFRIDRVWQNPLQTQTEYMSLRDQASKSLTSARADALAGEYIKDKMKAVNPIIKADGFNIVRAYLAEKGLTRDTQVKWDIPATFMTEAGPLPISSSAKLLSRPLVTFARQTLNVRDYIRWFDIRQFQLKTNSLAAFNSSVKKTIWKMVQDKLLSQEAYSLGLNFRPSVQHEKKQWDAKLLYLAARSHIARTVVVSDSIIKREYDSHPHRYRDALGRPVKFDLARERIRIDLFYTGESGALLRTLQALQREIPVRINEEAVTTLSTIVPGESNPIDVILYKPGGTFPRVAFPTIDERWESFPSIVPR